jgi:hypothetical protein
MKKLSAILLPLLLAACAQQAVAPQPGAALPKPAVYQGQGPIREAVNTSSRPTDRQRKGVFPFNEDGVYFSNEFDGARLNDIVRTGPRAYTISITPENAPINMSPWYAFQVWATTPGEIAVKLVYPDAARHRYTPQLSRDGLQWTPLEPARIAEQGRAGSDSATARPKSIVMTLQVEAKPLWVSGQELQTSQHVFAWMDDIARRRGLTVSEIGKSTGGRPIKLLTIGNKDGKKAIMIISRQHPPEVTGYFAMQAFVDTLAGDSELAQQFRRDWTIYVVPLMNPDGVDGGFWRHNVGGIDLNRDWSDFNQPETRAVRDFLKRRTAETGARFYFGIDFHSTWDDIYYTLDPKFKGNMPGLVPAWLAQVQRAIPNYQPLVQSSDKLEPTTVSRNYFLKAYGMESIVFEIGDNSSRERIRQKGEIGATELMKLMLSPPQP